MDPVNFGNVINNWKAIPLSTRDTRAPGLLFRFLSKDLAEVFKDKVYQSAFKILCNIDDPSQSLHVVYGEQLQNAWREDFFRGTRAALYTDFKRQEGRYPYIIFDVSLSRRGGWGHANILLLDTRRKTMEFFEPHGWAPWHDLVYQKLMRLFPGYHIWSPALLCPQMRGPQSHSSLDEGWCMTWSVLYVVYRILNPAIPPEDIATWMGRGSGEQIRDRMYKILGYIDDRRGKHDRYFDVHKQTPARLVNLRKLGAPFAPPILLG